VVAAVAAAVVDVDADGVTSVVIACWLVFDIVVGVVVDIAGDSHWLWLRYRARIDASYS